MSVVIPVYNARAWIAETLQGALGQTWPALEVICVDDGSQDGSPDFIREHFPAVRVIEQANQGQAVARNRGVAEARGEVIAFLDADDVWFPGKIARQMEVFAAHPAAAFIHSGWARPGWQGEAAGGRVVELSFLALAYGYFVCPSGVVVRRDLFEDVGGFRAERTGIEDRDLWSRLSRDHPAYMVGDVLWLYRLTPKKHLDFRLRHLRASFELLDELRPFFRENYSDAAWQTVMAGQCYRYLFYFRRDGSSEGARITREMLSGLDAGPRRRAFLRLYLPYLAARARKAMRATETFADEPLPPPAAFTG